MFEGTLSKDKYMLAVDQVKKENIDFLLAVGGGSVLDGTKFVAAATLYDGDPTEILKSFDGKVTKAMPFGSVLTLPATGSEMNNGGVITIKAIGAKLPFLSKHVFPRFSVLDPTKTYTLPQHQLANGVVDAFIHVMEQYLTYPVGGFIQDRFAESLLLTLIEHGPPQES
jgi:NADP-dependent alcohol dehydrogenase